MKISKKLLLCMFAAFACVGLVSAYKPVLKHKFEDVVKGKLWDKYERFKKAGEIPWLSLTSEQKIEWNSAVDEAHKLLTELEQFNKANNNAFVNDINRTAEVHKLISQMMPISEKARGEVEKTPEYKKIEEDIKKVDEARASIMKRIESIEEGIKGTQAKISPLRSKFLELKQKQSEIMGADPEFEQGMEQIEKEHGGPRGIAKKWFEAMEALEARIWAKYAEKEEHKKLTQQIKDTESELAPLEAEIKPEMDKIGDISAESYEEFKKKMELNKRQEELVEQHAQKNPIYKNLAAQLKKLQEEEVPDPEKTWEGYRIKGKYEDVKRKLIRIYRAVMNPQAQ